MRTSETNIAVTGAVGFIGSQILDFLLTIYPSSSIIAVDHPITENKIKNLTNVTRVKFLDHQTFLHQLETHQLNPRIIVHMGACSSTTERNWSYLYQNNVVYSQKIFNWCAKNESRLIYASSAATYGHGEFGFDDESPIEPLKPLNLYGQSKQAFDKWVQDKTKSKVTPPQCVGLKFFNVFGNGEFNKGGMASMVLHGYIQAISTGSIKLFKSHHPSVGDGEQSRDFVYINDIVQVIFQIIQNPNVSGLYNLGTGTSRTFNNLAKIIFDSVNLPLNVEYIPMPSDLSRQYQAMTCATTRKIERAGIKLPRTKLEDAVKDYISQIESQETGKS